MRVMIISVPAQKMSPPDYVKSLAKGIESMGHRVDILDAWTEDGTRLPGYEYIVVVAEAASFFSGKISTALSKVLSSASSLSGKKSAAFLKKGSLFANKAITNIMRTMEKEGMFVNWSDILLNASHAEAMGKRIGM